MTKENFITEVAAKADISKKDATTAVKAFMETLTEALAADDKVTFVGFGTFEVKTRAARTGRNPRTGETMEIPATKIPHFKPGKSLKDAVNA